ncbi:hypothetical protein AB1K62_02125 [Parasphingorhabdus sp. JC815]|uniref:hypothetical protein n=1 Tax=Parasphingorhabdus sp. JC815 TaxID=3232140 RepID=UPI003457F9A3
MQFIKTLFWVILAVILVVFAVNNWTLTSVQIWGDVRIDTKMPVLVIGAFLLGFFPLWLIHRTTKWRLNRRIKTLEVAAQPTKPVATTPETSPKSPLDLKKGQMADPASSVASNKVYPPIPPTDKDEKAGK